MATKTAKKATKKKSTPKTDPAVKAEQKAFATLEKKKAGLMKKFPALTDNDFVRFQGEGIDSVHGRLAERTGVSVAELGLGS